MKDVSLISTTHRWPGTAVLMCLALLSVGYVQAAGEVTDIETRDTTASPSRYTVGNTTVQWGQSNNLLLDAFIANDRRHTAIRTADRVELRRVDRPAIATGEPCGIFAESADGSQLNVAPDFPELAAGNGNCDVAAILASYHVNRGALDLFSNRPPTAKNIERIDFIFDGAVNAPFDVESLPLAGHLVGDKSGNNPLQVAAIVGVDASALPTAFGPLIRIGVAGCADPDLCYGTTSVMQRYAFLESESIAPQGPPVPFTNFSERAAFAFVSAKALGLSPGQRYHGLSLFPDDVDLSVHDLLDPTTFPDDTEDAGRSPGDSVDVFGGGAGLYLGDTVSKVPGLIECRASDTDDTTPIIGASIQLHVDLNENGVLDDAERPILGEPVSSIADGAFDLTGLADGSYLMTVEDPDPAQPPGSILASVTPVPFVVSGNSTTSVQIELDCNDAAIGPTATADSVTLFQPDQDVPLGASVIDVLLNDLDPLDEGLQVVAVQGASNGAVAIADDGQVISYTPSPGIFRQDAFTYTVEDGAGRRDVGDVTVTVSLVFDDPGDNPTCIPGGPIDGCVIETEVDGHGFGRVGALSLIALLVWAGNRWRGRLPTPGAADPGRSSSIGASRARRRHGGNGS